MNINELFNITPDRRESMPKVIDLLAGIDPHVHLRNNSKSGDGRMEMAVKGCSEVYEYVVAIGNTSPPVCDAVSAQAYLKQARACVPRGSDLKILMAPLVNDNTDPEMVLKAWDKPDGQEDFHALKIFFQGVSNDYGNSVSDIRKIEPLIRSTTQGLVDKKRPIPITFHAERREDRNGKILPIKDREWYCVEHDIADAIKMNPEATFVLRHVSDGRTFQWGQEQRMRGINIHFEICPQYCIAIDDDIFQSDDGKAVLQCNCICWPRFKDAWSRQKNMEAALSGLPYFHFALDYALHLHDMSQHKNVKINSLGEAVGGLNFMPTAARSIMIDLFVSHGKTHLLDDFLSLNAAKLYGVELSNQKWRYHRRDWVVPEYTYGRRGNQRIKSVCFLHGQTMHWKLGI